MTQRAHNPETFVERLARLHELREATMHSSPEAEAKQHDRGKFKLTTLDQSGRRMRQRLTARR